MQRQGGLETKSSVSTTGLERRGLRGKDCSPHAPEGLALGGGPSAVPEGSRGEDSQGWVGGKAGKGPAGSRGTF